MVQFKIVLNVPWDATSLSSDFAFFSEEFLISPIPEAWQGLGYPIGSIEDCQ